MTIKIMNKIKQYIKKIKKKRNDYSISCFKSFLIMEVASNPLIASTISGNLALGINTLICEKSDPGVIVGSSAHNLLSIK